MKYPKLRELKEAIRALIQGPYTTKYPYEPHKPYERFRGRPYFHEEDCIGCTACAQVCPTGAIEIQDEVKNNKAKRKLIVHWDICIFCGQCQANCLTEKGIVLSQEFDFATTEKRGDLKQEIEKELLTCDACGDAIVPPEQFSWVAQRLGPLAFSNSSLMLFYLKVLSLALKAKPVAKQELEFNRSDRIKILCPRCRRQAVIKS